MEKKGMTLEGIKQTGQEDKSNHLDGHRQRFVGNFFSSDKNRLEVCRRLHVRFFEVFYCLDHNVISSVDKEKLRIRIREEESCVVLGHRQRSCLFVPVRWNELYLGF